MENSGIYCITNLINNKKYIGKSINIKRRFIVHKSDAKRNSKDINRYLKSSFLKYGFDNFKIEIIEYIPVTESDKVFKERELYWIKELNTVHRDYGYNLRMDSSTEMFVHEETKKLQSENNMGEKNPNYGNKWTQEQREKASLSLKEAYANGTLVVSEETKQRMSVQSTELWKNKEIKQQMINSLKATKRKKYRFIQYDLDMNVVKIWDAVEDIIAENPTYKWQNIYSVCNGYKKRIYGYVWKKENKI